MKSKFLLIPALALFTLLASCGKDNTDNQTDNQVDNTTQEPFPTDLDEYITALTGSTADSSLKIWNGSQAFRRYYNPATREYGEESEVTNDPDIKFKEMSLEMKYDQYNSERFGYNVGSSKWVDPMGKTSMFWELENAIPDTLYMNRNKSTAQIWAVQKLNEKEFEFTRKWKSGGTKFIERLIWVK
ncbi:MAG: hypothetical protein KDC92_00835 [Bacteroidetes bacterium]|nr:hypothetical protein [Bacteroidota bacterium]